LSYCINGNVGSVLGIYALSLGYTSNTGFTFKLVHGEKMAENYGHISLNRYVLQVFCTLVIF